MNEFTAKQKETWQAHVNNARRWNISVGATRSGKTYLDYFKIPHRIRNAEPGLILLLGNTKGTLERNILDPMRDMWTNALVGNIGSDNKVKLFGRECYALGAEKVNQVSKIQGAGFAYVYGDEVATWNEDVFGMLKSRIDRKGAVFDGTSNPDHPNHWLKGFLDSNADINLSKFKLDDNTVYVRDNPGFIENLKKEYYGTVWYQRLVLGEWVAAQGAIYRMFADSPEKYRTKKPRDLVQLDIGVDFGGGKAGHAFVAVGANRGYRHLIALKSARYLRDDYANDIDPELLGELFCDFVQSILTDYGTVHNVYCDSAEQTLIAGLRASTRKRGLGWLNIHNAMKIRINDRVRATQRLIAQDRFRVVTGECDGLEQALIQAVWNPKAELRDERLDDGTSDIDTLDAFEYAWERDISRYITGGLAA